MTGTGMMRMGSRPRAEFAQCIQPISRQHAWRSDVWVKLAPVLVLGFLCFHRSFAYLGWPAHSIYVGEVSLAAFLLLGPKTRLGGWVWALLVSRPLRTVALLVVFSLLYGFFEAYRGVSAGYGNMTALRGTPFNYYPIFLLWGIWTGLMRRNVVEQLVRPLAWFNGIYGTAYLLFLHRLPWTLPGTPASSDPVPLFGMPYGSAISLLALVAFEPRLRRVWHLIALNLFVLLGMQIRGEWVGLAVGLLIFILCTKRLEKFQSVILAVTAVALILVTMYVGGVSLSLPERAGIPGRQISPTFILARVVAPFDEGLAERLAPYGAVHQAAANAGWRLNLWRSVLKAVNESPSSALFGLGYGYPMWNFVNPITSTAPLQSPHNDFFYALGFTGWIGAAVFVCLQLSIGRLLFRSFRLTGRPFGLVCWGALLAISTFEGFLEEPFGAIPFYLLTGMAVAAALLPRRPVQRLTYRPYARRFRTGLPVRPGTRGIAPVH